MKEPILADTTDLPPATLFEQIGGESAVEAVVNLFYDRVLADPLLVGYFGGIEMDRLKRHQQLFIGQALGAKRPFPGRTMKRAHEGLAITGAAFDRVVEHLTASLSEAGHDKKMIGSIVELLAPLKMDIVTS
ncbi:group 1 truncated hemoglobin [Streptomyces sp. NBC_01613]|uniref:group I truncated hemoglobin n=1 Tax=Streptomyces sp. NBC_01613 TaxID=2975896 RepID=UPI0038692402